MARLYELLNKYYIFLIKNIIGLLCSAVYRKIYTSLSIYLERMSKKLFGEPYSIKLEIIVSKILEMCLILKPIIYFFMYWPLSTSIVLIRTLSIHNKNNPDSNCLKRLKWNSKIKIHWPSSTLMWYPRFCNAKCQLKLKIINTMKIISSITS